MCTHTPRRVNKTPNKQLPLSLSLSFFFFFLMCVCTKPTLVFFASYVCACSISVLCCCRCYCCCYHWCCVALHKSERWENKKIGFSRLTLSLQKKGGFLFSTSSTSSLFYLSIKLKHKLNQYNNKQFHNVPVSSCTGFKHLKIF